MKTEDIKSKLRELENTPQNQEINLQFLSDIPNQHKTYKIQIYIQLLRIAAPHKILTDKNITYLFTNLFELDKNVLFTQFEIIVTYKIYLLCNISTLKKFLDSSFKYKKILKIKKGIVVSDDPVDDYVKKILYGYLEEKEEAVESFFNFLKLQKNCPTAQSFFNHGIFINNINSLSNEQDYVNLFLALNDEFKLKINLKYIQNKPLKKKYLTCIVSLINSMARYEINQFDDKENINFITEYDHEDLNSTNDDSIQDKPNQISCQLYYTLFQLYKDDVIGKLFLIVERNCCSNCKGILQQLQNDSEWKVRVEANKIGTLNLERILDVSKEVRNVILERIVNKQLFTEEIILNLFKGCGTKAKSEYFNILKKVTLNFDFLYQNKCKEIKVYLKQKLNLKNNVTNQISNSCTFSKDENEQLAKIKNFDKFIISNLNCGSIKKLRFFFKYYCNETLSHELFSAVVEKDPYSAYLYLKNNSIYDQDFCQLLFNNVNNTESIKHFKRIVIFLSRCLITLHNKDIVELKNERDCILFFALKTNINDEEVKHFIEKLPKTYNYMYSIAQFSKQNILVFEIVHEYLKTEKNLENIFEILIRSEQKELLIAHFEHIFTSKIDTRAQKILKEDCNSISLLLYFFCGGTISKFSISFLLETIFILCKSLKTLNTQNLDKVSVLYKNYYKNITKENDKLLFNNVIHSLKIYFLSENEIEYNLHNNKLDITLMPCCDIILYYIADLFNCKNTETT
ncbi:hypothetical protein COBT_002337, partial [Conglomerata obtusa]